jgi:hypothetical protein
MLILFDRGFCSHLFFREAAANGAGLVFGVSASFKLTPIRVLAVGTYLAQLNPQGQTRRATDHRPGDRVQRRFQDRALGGKATSSVFALVTNLTDPDWVWVDSK